jgi:hypothetical protein
MTVAGFIRKPNKTGSQKSYREQAREKGNTYFDLGEKGWNDALEKVGGDMDQMWRIKKQFLDEQAAQGKSFDLASDPSPGSESCIGFYRREIAYLRKLGYKVVRQGEVWYAYR